MRKLFIYALFLGTSLLFSSGEPGDANRRLGEQRMLISVDLTDKKPCEKTLLAQCRRVEVCFLTTFHNKKQLEHRLSELFLLAEEEGDQQCLEILNRLKKDVDHCKNHSLRRRCNRNYRFKHMSRREQLQEKARKEQLFFGCVSIAVLSGVVFVACKAAEFTASTLFALAKQKST